MSAKLGVIHMVHEPRAVELRKTIQSRARAHLLQRVLRDLRRLQIDVVVPDIRSNSCAKA